MTKPLTEMRNDYRQAGLEESSIAVDPFSQFQLWFDQATEHSPGDWFEPNAMSLATSSPTGEVTSRIVLLKGIADGAFRFYTSHESDKGRQLEANPQAALNFYWPHLERQVRIVGSVAKLPNEVAEPYFHSRPRGSQIGAAASRQSSVVASREELAERFGELESQHAGEVPMPDWWGGYGVTPSAIEFWQGRPNRLHDRLRYRRDHDKWIVERLSP